MERISVIVDEETALDNIKDGMTIALGGFITAQHPMSIIRGLPRLNPDLKPFKDPIKNENLLAVSALKIDVAITHAPYADSFGNVQYEGSPFVDGLMQRAAEMTITSVEKVVPSEFIRRDPFKTEYTADQVVRMPFGAHPYSCHNYYREDEDHLARYATAAYTATKGDSTDWDVFQSRYINSPRVLVEKCNIISAMGFGDETPDLRQKLNMPGKGPKYCITPLCIFDFSPRTNRLRLYSLHPGVTVDQVIESTGFKVEIPETVTKTKPPTDLELKVLRTRVDPDGMLRTS